MISLRRLLMGATIAVLLVGGVLVTNDHLQLLEQFDIPSFGDGTITTTKHSNNDNNNINNNNGDVKEPIKEEWATTRRTTQTTSTKNSNSNSNNNDEEVKEPLREETNNKDDTTTNNDKDKGRPNILLFYGDDWTLKTLGVLNKFVKTPNLDKMTETGMLFTHNCVTTSICMVSRATLYTGQYASRHETYLPQDRTMMEPGKWNETLWPLLYEHGYYTGMVGKWHHPKPPAGTFHDYHEYQTKHYIERDGVTKHVTVWNEEDALHFLDERPKEKLFALMVSFFAIHAEDFGTEKYRPQNTSMGWYVDDTIPTPKTATDEHFQLLPHFFRNGRNFGRGRWKKRYDTPELFQKMMKNMYRMVTEVDETCGKILAKLEEQGVLDNTMVIFTTDNGNMHGEHGLAEKWFPYEESIRVPLIIQDPRMPKNMAGTTNSDFTLNIDLAPTILAAAKIPIPKVMQGRDMSQLYMGDSSNGKSTRAWRDEFYYEWFTGNKDDIPASLALVRKDSKYIEWPEWDTEELFRLDNDPFEEKNLFSSNLTTDKRLFDSMKARMADLKALAKSGVPM